MIGFVYQYWSLSIFFIDWEQPRTIQHEPKYDSPHTSLRKMYCNRFPRNENKSTIMSDVIASKRKKRLHRSNRNASPSAASKSSSTDKYISANFSSVCSLTKFPPQETIDHIQNFPISIWRTLFIANEWCKLQTKRRINITLQSIYTLCILQVSKPRTNFFICNIRLHLQYEDIM